MLGAPWWPIVPKPKPEDLSWDRLAEQCFRVNGELSWPKPIIQPSMPMKPRLKLLTTGRIDIWAGAAWWPWGYVFNRKTYDYSAYTGAPDKRAMLNYLSAAARGQIKV